MDPSFALQIAVVAALRASASLSALVGTRVFDRAPQRLPIPESLFPYVQIRAGQSIDNGAECLEMAAEVYLDIDVWSRSVGQPECKTIAGHIRGALHRPVTLPTLQGAWLCKTLNVQSINYFNESDGVTTHAVLSVRALIDPT